MRECMSVCVSGYVSTIRVYREEGDEVVRGRVRARVGLESGRTFEGESKGDRTQGRETGKQCEGDASADGRREGEGEKGGSSEVQVSMCRGTMLKTQPRRD